MLTPAQALVDIRGYAAAGRIEYTEHAIKEMDEAHADFGDTRHALMKAVSAVFQNNGRWKIRGPDRDGDELILAVTIDDGILVITVF